MTIRPQLVRLPVGRPRPGRVRPRCRTGPASPGPSSRCPSMRTTSTANPPPARPTIAVTGTFRASRTPVGRDLHLHRGLVEPACLFRVVEADVGGDRCARCAGALAGGDVGDSSQPVHSSRHRRIAWQRDLGTVASLHLALLRRIEGHLHLERVGRRGQNQCARLSRCRRARRSRSRSAPTRAGTPPDRDRAIRSDPRPASPAASERGRRRRSRRRRRTGRAARGSRTRDAPGWR